FRVIVADLFDVSARRTEILGANGKVHGNVSIAAGLGDHVHRSLNVIRTNGLHDSIPVGRRLLVYTMKFEFGLAARGTDNRPSTIPAVIGERRILFKLLFGDAFLAHVGAGFTGHHRFHTGALVGRYLGQSVGRKVRHGRHAAHRM